MYQLKKGVQSFTVVEGPLANQTFSPGESYAEIPPGEEAKFEIITASGQPSGISANPPVIPAEAGIQKNKQRAVAPDPPSETKEEVK